MQRFPVTNAEYFEFLNDLRASGRQAVAELFAPRERTGVAKRLGQPIVETVGGRWVPGLDGDGVRWGDDWPALLVDYACQVAYCRWLSERTGLACRMPTKLEFEKAARGVDGRFSPWGDVLDPTGCVMADSDTGRRLPGPVDATPVDESPYGVRGLAGNIRCLTTTRFTDEGSAGADGRAPVEPMDDLDPETNLVARGGCWSANARNCRAASRQRVQPPMRMGIQGIRLVRTF